MPGGHRLCQQLSLDRLGRTNAVLIVLTATAAAAAAPDVAAQLHAGGLTNVVCSLQGLKLCLERPHAVAEVVGSSLDQADFLLTRF